MCSQDSDSRTIFKWSQSFQAILPDRSIMSSDNHFFFFRTLWGSLENADWQEAGARGHFALVAEFFRALAGLSAWPFFVPAESGWRSATIRPILELHGIESWGWGRHGDEIIFQVKLSQANWAQYLLKRNGVPVTGQLLDEEERSAYRPVAQRSQHRTPGALPSEAKSVPPLAEAEAQGSLLRDPVGQINRTIDRLAKW
jgi:hypothetical protein